MVVLIDTNVILDYLLERQPQFIYADSVFSQCRTKRVKGFVAFHSISTIWYLLRKRPQAESRSLLTQVTDLLTVTSASHEEVVNAIKNENFSDFEDCLQEKMRFEHRRRFYRHEQYKRFFFVANSRRYSRRNFRGFF